jgi:copper transport protein
MTLMRCIRLFLVTLTLACLLTGPRPVWAHAILESSDPPNYAVLSESPRQIVLKFSETVAVRFSSTRLLDMNGRAVEGLRISQDPTQPRQLIIDVPPLSQGIYSLNWKTLSTSDGHSSQGLLVFGINQSVEGGASGAAPAENPPPVLQIVSRTLVDAGLCGLFGTLIVTLALLFQNRKNSPLIQAAYYRARQRASGWVITLTGLAFLAGLVQWLAQVPSSSGEAGSFATVDWSAALPLLVSTPWGNFWLVRQALLLLAGVYLILRRVDMVVESNRLDWALGAGLVSLILISYTLSTHAAGLNAPILPLFSGLLHLMSAGLWVGGLVGLLLVLLPLMFKEGGAFEFFQLVWRGFGRFAAVAVGLTFTTGLINTAGLVASSGALVTSLYGKTLLVKVGLVLVVGLMGIANSLSLHPNLRTIPGKILRRPAGWSPFNRQYLPITILIEASLGLIVIALAGFLASTPPANTPEDRYIGTTQSDSVTLTVDDLLVTLTLRPNYPGQNILDVRASSTRRPAPAEILRVIVHMTYQGDSLGTQSADASPIETGLYRLGGSFFSLPGPWKIDVVVRRKGIPDLTAAFDWNVVPPVSNPLGIDFLLVPALWIGAAGFMLLTLGSAWFLFRRKFTDEASSQHSNDQV